MRIGARVLGWLALAICLLTTVPAAAGFVCVVDGDCDDGLFCNGTEFCVEGSCVALSACPPFVDGCVTSLGCDEITDTCLVGPDDSLCDDGVFCNGVEQCNGDTKECAAIDSCPAAIVGCVTYGSCDEDTDTCPGVPDDGLCPIGQTCQPDGMCLPGTTTTTSTVTTSTVTTTTSTVATTVTSSTLATTTTAVSSTTTTEPTTTTSSSTTTTLPADDHPLAGAKLLLKDRPTDTNKRRLQVLSRDGAALGLADVSDVAALIAAGGTLRVTAVGGDAFDATYPLPADGWALLKAKTPAKGVRFKNAGGPITKITLKAGKQLQVQGKGTALEQSLGAEPDEVRVELRIGTRRYCLAFGGTSSTFTAGKTLNRKSAAAPAACP